MASSTSRPMASTMPKSVSTLIEYPKAASTPKVPSSTTGTVMAGMTVARQFCRNRYMTTTTSAMASSSVLMTDLIEIFTKRVVSSA